MKEGRKASMGPGEGHRDFQQGENGRIPRYIRTMAKKMSGIQC